MPNLRHLLFICASLASTAASAQGIAVDSRLAELVEKAVAATRVNVNVPPRLMEADSLQIDKIDGLGVCEAAAKDKVLALQRAFAKSSALKSTISAFGVYVRQPSGEVLFSSADAPEIQAQLGECRYLYVSVLQRAAL